MADSRTPKLLKGAIVQFTKMPIVPIPNIIVFQYNPESLQRSMSPYEPRREEAAAKGPPSAQPTAEHVQPYDPTETFTLSLLLDASDALEHPESHPVAFATGVADRIAALEMLMYPAGDSLMGKLLGSVNVSVSIGAGGISASASMVKTVPRREVPVILFVWGPGRILPVRLTTFNVEEQQYNQWLYPHRARVTIGMKVLSKESIDKDTAGDTAKDLAKFCYDFTRGQKEALALANVANTVESILGMLPF
jgi:hypothetical protein